MSPHVLHIQPSPRPLSSLVYPPASQGSATAHPRESQGCLEWGCSMTFKLRQRISRLTTMGYLGRHRSRQSFGNSLHGMVKDRTYVVKMGRRVMFCLRSEERRVGTECKCGGWR